MPQSMSPLTIRITALVVAALGTSSALAARQTPLAEFQGLPGDYAGFAIARAGDVDNDGFQDVLVGVPRALTSSGLQGGSVWLTSGRYLVTGVGAPRIHRWEALPNGGQSQPRFGHALASADIDLDGVPDVIVGSPREDSGGSDAGSVRVFSGATGGQLASFSGTPHQAYGWSVAVAGDVNGDGWVDILAGAPLYDTTFGTAYGRVYVLSGEWIARTGAGLNPSTQPTLTTILGNWNHDDLGQAVAPFGDLDGNGLADFVVGADHGGPLNGGYFGVVMNGASTMFVQVTGSAPSEHFGSALAACGDVDGDGIQDLLVGAWGSAANGPAGSQRGRVEMIRGAWLLATGSGLPPTVSRSVWARPGESDFDLYGWRVTAVGDLDLDGAQDVAVSAVQFNQALPPRPGFVDVLSGRDGHLLFRTFGATPGALFGNGLAGVGDIDGDGQPDLGIGAPTDAVGGAYAGAVRVVRGFPEISTQACPSATANSTGAVAHMVARGSASASDAALFLELTQAPPSRPVVFFRGNSSTQVPFGNGVRCVGGSLLRFGATTIGSNGALVRAFDLAAQPVGSSFVVQAWFDDAFAGGAGFNTSDAAWVTVAP